MGQFLANLPWILSLIYLVIVLGFATLLHLCTVNETLYFSRETTTFTIVVIVLEALAVFYIWRHSTFSHSLILAACLWIAQLLLVVYALTKNNQFQHRSRSRVAFMMFVSWAMLATVLVLAFG